MDNNKQPDTEEIVKNVMENLKHSLEDIKTEIKDELKADIDSIREDMKSEFAGMKTERPPFFEPPPVPFPPPPFDADEDLGRFSDNTVSEYPYDLTDFDSIRIEGTFDTEIVQAESYKVTVTASASLLKNLDVSKNGTTLEIRHSRHIGWRAALSRPKAQISLPVLKKLRLSGATKTVMNGFTSPESFNLKMSGASYLSGDITAESAEMDLSGASYAGISGAIRDAIVKASGANRLDLRDLVIENAAVKLSGASRMTAHITGRLDARLSGASHFGWVGEPVMGDIRTSGAATMRKEM